MLRLLKNKDSNQLVPVLRWCVCMLCRVCIVVVCYIFLTHLLSQPQSLRCHILGSLALTQRNNFETLATPLLTEELLTIDSIRRTTPGMEVAAVVV